MLIMRADDQAHIWGISPQNIAEITPLIFVISWLSIRLKFGGKWDAGRISQTQELLLN